MSVEKLGAQDLFAECVRTKKYDVITSIIL